MMSERRPAARFVAYAAVGATGTVAQYLVLIALVRLNLTTAAVGSMAGAIVGALVNYWLNRCITFRSTASHLSTLPKFAAIAGVGVVVSGLVMKALTEDHHVNYLFAQVVASTLVLVLTYLINSAWTFKTRRPVADAGFDS
ncbi:putative flippase GtrA [Paraburkholderia sp. GAS333]|uniref:GtrA family protein n=1 Tax=Paraburkholderia sp. GAS333 TaxID=3156279 RepID=UPI003D227003